MNMKPPVIMSMPHASIYIHMYILSRMQNTQAGLGLAFMRITCFRYRNINHFYQWNYCFVYFGLYFGYQRLISVWEWEAQRRHDQIVIKETSRHIIWLDIDCMSCIDWIIIWGYTAIMLWSQNTDVTVDNEVMEEPLHNLTSFEAMIMLVTITKIHNINV